MPIQFAIEGTNAEEAARTLTEIPGITGTWESAVGGQKEGILATIATVVGIVGGMVSAADQIHKWYAEYKKSKSGGEPAKVIIIGKDGKRLSLEGATSEQIQKVLETL
ncbi:MAG: hypothetical protein V2I97_06680 [Desulfococcaceae bacterium]|jgi:hypothetical protein|nr:hypothetical protein [Desulfococcaceae bacterium]